MVKFNYKYFGIFRFILALLVVISHFSVFLAEAYALEFRILGLGNMAVVTFFILSGYVMTESNEVFYKKRTGKFLINRILRIVPPYYMALIFSIFIHYALYVNNSDILYSTLTQNLNYKNDILSIFSFNNVANNFSKIFVWHGLNAIGFIHDHTFVRYIWAVVVEMKFYVIIAILFFIIYNKNNKNFGRYAFFMFFILYVASFFYESLVIKVFGFFPYFSFGMIVYYYQKNAGGKVLLGVGGVVSFVLIFIHFYTYISSGGEFSIVSLFILLFLMLVFIWLTSANIALSQKIDKFFGDMSYSLYLNHFAIQVLFLYLGLHGLSIFIIGVLLSVLTSYVLNLIVDPFTIKLRNKIRGSSI
jgi:peptidoglycan/LPS O-acetylase OafA/YrhL